MKELIKFFTAIIAACLLYSNTVLASPVINETSKTNDTNATIEKLDSEIENTMRKVDDNKKEISKAVSDIKSVEGQIKDNDNNIKQKEDILKKRVRAAYINGSDGYLKVILDSTDFGDFISRMDTVQKIVAYDNNTIADLNSKKQKMELQRKTLSENKDKLLTLKSDNEKKLAKLNSDKENEKKLIAQAKAQEVSTQKVYAQAASANTLSRGSLSISSSNNSDVVSYASQFLGVPYVWGGTSPSGFDCSGFVQYVYAHFGIGLGRTTYEQINDGSPVSREQLQAGDLVLFGSSSNPHHVGIYVGGGEYIHAPQTGDVVKVSSLDSRGDFVVGRRVK